MTAAMVGLACLAAGLLVSLLVIRRSRTRWLLAGQHQAELTHGRWHPVVTEGWNRQEAPQSRRRSPDHQMTARTMSAPIHRSVFYDR